MKYGYFDDEAREYVITRPDTPRSWTNYLGSTEYGAIITNNAGGYSFYKSAAQGRFTRYRSNAVPMDQPGRNIYIRDQENGDYWSNAWQPVGKNLDEFQSECRHGTAYSTITSTYSGIQSKTSYFVPLGESNELWYTKVTNTSDRPRKLRLFTFVEYTNNWNLTNDLLNLQYSAYIVKMSVHNGIVDHGTNVSMDPNPENFQDADQGRHTFLAISGAEVSGYDTDREKFLGPYRSYHNPQTVERGECGQSLAVADNGCGTLQIDIELAPGETKDFCVIMGIGRAEDEGLKAQQRYADMSCVRAALADVKNYWHSRLDNFTIETPDAELNSFFNTWNPYNCLITFAWSRAASLVYNGERDGLGYRDTVQDMLGTLHSIPAEAQQRLELMLTGQVSTGGAMPVVKPFAHSPGSEARPKESEYRSDDSLWLFNTIPSLVKETGDLSFYDKVLPYADEGEDSVLGHMKRAIEFSLNRLGKHGLPCGLLADWNDCLVLGQDGETVFVALQLRYALATYVEICEMKEQAHEVAWAETYLEILDKNLDQHCWDGEWYRRAFRVDGFVFGSCENEEASIFLNPQSWSVISGHASKEKAHLAMNSVKQRLATDAGLMVLDPPVTKLDPDIMRARLFNPGMKENGAVFCHTQGWVVMAESLLGNGDRSYQYLRSFMPAAFNEKAEIRESEPYVYCQSTHSKYSPRYGASRLPWLTGAATWAYHASSQYMLGIRPEYKGLTIDPCIPSSWSGFKATRTFRGITFHIEVQNPKGVQKGIQSITVNGESYEGNTIDTNSCTEHTSVLVIMG
ncbi:Cellobiose phosphorylase [Alteromonadaceae bacterium Bs31]|nr:Cellobiose phosphorylase [Alteromonadaceae bacterium Bs31]